METQGKSIMMKLENGRLRTVLAVAIASATLAGCGSNDSTVVAPGNMTVQLQGGTGGVGAGKSGGNGNYFELYKRAGAGDVKVLATGAVNASFTSQSFTPDFGAVPAVVSANTDLSTVLANCAAAEPAAGTLYQVVDDSRLFKAAGTATACETADVVTGLDVASGVTLKLGNNWNGATQAYINIGADIRNNGTITVADVSATQRGSIDLEPNSYIGSGKIDTSGTASAPNAGSIYIYGDYAMINSGKMTASGADSATVAGGNAGYIDLESGYYTQNTGDLTARGGNTTAAALAGGSANYVELYADWGPTYNSGNIDGRGGEGATGGSAADVYFYAYLGKLFNSGNVMAYGANSTTGNGGNGGYIDFEANAGEIRNSGNMQGWGGNTTDTAGNGGSGNELYVYTDYGSLQEYSPAGDIHWSGQIDLHGGNAVATGTGNGGSAGNVYAEISGYWINLHADLVFLGYSNVKTHGGDGNHGGSAGSYELYNYDGYVYGYQDAPSLGGNVVNEANLVAHGGNAVADGADASGWGGRGGYVNLETDTYATAQLVPDSQMVKHTGNIDISGGNGRNQTNPGNNYSGGAWIWGYNGVSFTGNVAGDGGDDKGTTTGAFGYGSYANSFEVYSELGLTAVKGNISVTGGDGNHNGGWTYGAVIDGNTVQYSGTINANGGNARVLEPGSQGGSGGYIELKAIRPEASSVSATATYAGGTGATAGTEGGIMRLISCTGAGC